jgi:hypothetical protein
MKCPRCWAEKAYLRPVSAWKTALFSCLLLVPLRCQHCYHKFNVLWFFTVRKQVVPPRQRIITFDQQAGPSLAAQHYQSACEQHTDSHAREGQQLPSPT